METTKQVHEFDPVSFVLGLSVTAIGVAGLLLGIDVHPTIDLRLLGPAGLVFAAALVLAVSMRRTQTAPPATDDPVGGQGGDGEEVARGPDVTGGGADER